MAGRGRGKGRGLSFSVETLGFGRGESLPGPNLQPPPIFPPLEFKPVPLLTGEEYDYLLALKQEYRGGLRDSPYYIKLAEKKKDIERYSDKYQIGGQDNSSTWEPDWSRLPSELKLRSKKKRKIKAIIKPKIPVPVTSNTDGAKLEDISKTLEELEKKEEVEDDKEKEEKEGGEEEDIEEEFYDDEDLEEENDYNLNYFDNGEDGFDDDDDLDEGPVY